MRKWRQTFLNFQPLPKTCALENVSAQHKLSKPAADLPTEIWDLILKDLTSISLKIFRLVCQKWARVGSEWLFRTVYVDSYITSWKRLEQLSKSRYASRVRTIVWSSLDLPDRPLDIDEWLAHYPNLLAGTNHITTTKLYEAYRRCVRKKWYMKLEKDMYPKTVFSNLTNLCELVIRDDLDLESQCQDSMLCAYLRCDASFMESVAVWGHSPVIWRDRHTPVIEDFSIMFSLLADCSSLVSCRVALWDRHWKQCTEIPSYRWISHPKISRLDLTFKYCKIYADYLDDYEYRTSVIDGLHGALQCLSDLPELENLTVKPCFQEPCLAFREIYKKALYSEYELDESDHDFLCEIRDRTCDCNFEESSVTDVNRNLRTTLDMLYPTLSNSIEAIFHPGLVTMLKIRTLVLYDIVVDLNGLVAWLCQQASYSREELTIYFRGHILLYGLNIGLFYRLASYFRVTIVCDETVLVYDTENTQSHSLLQHHLGGYENCFFWHEYPDTSNPRNWWGVRHGFNREMIDTCIETLEPLTKPFGDFDRSLRIGTVQEPLSLFQTVRSGHFAQQEGRDLYYYCMDLCDDGTVNFFWTTFADSSKNLRKRANIHILIAAQKYHHDEHDPFMDHEDDMIANQVANEIAHAEDSCNGYLEADSVENEMVDAENQALISIYETELLGRDHFDSESLGQ